MKTEKLETAPQLFADIVVWDSNGQPVLLVEAKARAAGHKCIDQLIFYLQAVDRLISFAMLVNLEDIQIFQWNGTNLSGPVSSLKTAAVLQHYDLEFSSKRIFEPYLITLVEAWLRDLAYHWKSGTLPASKQLAAVGLLDQLKGGATQDKVIIGGDTLH